VARTALPLLASSVHGENYIQQNKIIRLSKVVAKIPLGRKFFIIL